MVIFAETSQEAGKKDLRHLQKLPVSSPERAGIRVGVLRSFREIFPRTENRQTGGRADLRELDGKIVADGGAWEFVEKNLPTFATAIGAAGVVLAWWAKWMTGRLRE